MIPKSTLGRGNRHKCFKIFDEYCRFVLGESRSVVVMDNCRIHDSDVTINIIRQKGGIPGFLPYATIHTIHVLKCH